MAGHPQNSAQGLFIKDQINIGAAEISVSSSDILFSGGIALSGQTDVITAASTYVKFPEGIALSAQTDVITQTATYVKLPTGLTLSAQTAVITQDASDVILPGGVKISNKKSMRANSTGITLTAIATKPATDNGACFTIISNSTGVCLAINSTGATWKYLLTTSVQPT